LQPFNRRLIATEQQQADADPFADEDADFGVVADSVLHI
jgi:hypothetical protein